MSNSVERTAREEIAIIGMAGRFPGARNISEFWKNLCGGLESIRSFTEQELVSCGVNPAVLNDPSYVNAGAVMDDAEWFASSFFGYSPREAELMDPQHRILLECAWEALECAGYDPYRYGGIISVYAGVALNSYFQNNLSGRPEIAQMLGQYQLTLGNEKDFVATRVAYKLNLKGPSFTVQTGCSTSLVAVHLACQSLLNGESDMAVVGGGRVRVPLRAGYFYVEGSIPSPDGHCRAFDAGANGCIVGSGMATVVLKRVSDAVRDGDVIHAVIKGSAINNDGSDKIGFTAPSVTGQAAVIGQALALADVSADTIGYVEAHGTGTSLGDPIEIAALTKAFREHTPNCGYCAIGSVKTNIGHLDAGAGVAGLIKAALALRYGAIPASLNFNSSNPQIDFATSPFFVNTRLTPWKRAAEPRRAGVSSFGIGGTNAHVIVEEAPDTSTSPAATAHQLLVISAKTASALDQATLRLAAHLRAQPAENLADVAYTLQTGRAAFTHRRCVVAGSPEEAARALEAADSRRVYTGAAAQQDPPVVFMFPGQGAQYVNMGADIYRTEPVFRDVVDRCATILQPLLDLDLRSVLFAAQGDTAAAEEQLHQTRITQPALFTVEYALAQLLQSWGIKPVAMIGHSVGEYVAGCVAGVFTLDEALMLIARRGQLVQAQPPGTMLAVRLPESDVRPLLSETLDIAAINAPRLCVVAGPHDAVAVLEKVLDDRGVAHKRLHTSHAFHSAMMDPVLPPFTELLRRTRLVPPQIPYVSNVTTRWITPGEATNPEYWAQHVRQTVRFADGLAELFREPRSILLEVGPGRTLTQLARQHPAGGPGQTTIVTLGDTRDEECANLRSALGRLWLAGVGPDWRAVHGAAPRRRVVLPTYPFERQRHWIDPVASAPIVSLIPIPAVPSATVPALVAAPIGPLRRRRLIEELKTILHELSGIELVAMNEEATFLELGFESLFLTQANAAFQRKFGVRTTFRQLIEQTPTIASLAAFIDEQLPPEVAATVTAPAAPVLPPPSRRPHLIAQIKQLLHELSGIELVAMNEEATFLELGFESLFLTQANAAFQRKFGVRTTFRQLLEQTPTIASLAAFIDEQTPPDSKMPPASSATIAAATIPASGSPVLPDSSRGSTLDFLGMQVASLAAQIDLMRQAQSQGASSPTVSGVPASVSPSGMKAADFSIPAIGGLADQTRGPWRPPERQSGKALTARQRSHLDALTLRLVSKTNGSKQVAQKHRAHLADPRTVGGFRMMWKELVYPLVVKRSSGSRVWDIDDNEYVDFVMGFGVNLFGHSPAFVMEAVQAQLAQGVEIGPQSPLAGEVARMFCEMTGAERAAFCNTGSEAVLAAIRMARTVTGRHRLATFVGDYHGIFDEMLGRAIESGGRRHTVPKSPGIPPKMVEEVLLLNYGDMGSLDVMREHARELAAVIVEPVQSRHPELQPRKFLVALRKMTLEMDIPLIFDEMITGFRAHPAGAQGFFDVEADIGTYGKVIGGGFPIGIVAGKARFLDALDGGMWRFGDESCPEAGVTWFAGTFVRHPIALAASMAVLTHLKAQGPALQKELNQRTAAVANTLQAFLERVGAPIRIEYFSSWMIPLFSSHQECATLLCFHLRDKGIHVTEGRAIFISAAHSDDDLKRFVKAFEASVIELQAGGFLPQGTSPQTLRPSGVYAVTPAGGNGARRSDEPTSTTDGKPTVAATCNDIVALTHAQMEVWLGCQFGAVASTVFNETSVIALQGEIDLKALRQAAQQVVDRHEALRTTFLPDGSGQIVASTLAVEVPLADLAALEPTARATRRAELLAAEGDEPFELEEGPLVRFQVWRQGPNDHELVVSCHHLVCDGVSFGVLLRDLAAFYEAAYTGAAPRLTAGGQFRDYIKWEQTGTPPADDAANEAYWLGHFADSVPVLDLPADQRRPTQMHFSGGLESTILSGSLVRDLRRLGATTGNTLYCVLLSAFHALLHRLSGQDDIVIGTPVSGQSLMGEPNIVGHCVNFLPLRIRSSGTRSVRAHLQATRNVILDAFDHANFTYGRLVRQLKMPRDPARLPLLGVSFNLDPKPHPLRFGAIETWDRGAPKRHVNLDLEFNLVELEDGLRLDCRYLRDVYSGETIRRWLGYYANLLVAYVKDSERAVDDLPLVSEAERQRVLVEWNATTADYPRDACVHQLFAAQAAQTPERVAVVCGGEQVTYRELNARANQLAHHLRAHGVGPDVTVGVCIERSVNLVVALLGVWKAGGAYIPIDPGYPPDRVAFVLGDAGATMLLTEQALARRPGLADIATVLCLDQDGIKIARESTAEPDVAVESKHLAYVIYTSGSTGRPKGVQIEHRAVVNFLQAMRKAPGLCNDDVMLAVTTISFDIAGLELFLPLTTGARVMLAPRETAVDGRALSNVIDTHGVTIMQATPTTWRIMLEAGWIGSPRLKILCGGEALPQELVRELLPRCAELWNMYGPTETTIWSTCCRLSSDDDIHIGRPIANTEAFIVDAGFRPVPIGVRGELLLGGDGVARGYWQRPELSAEKFITHPLRPGAQLYRTGDVARYRSDGNIECLGRVDFQVKIRGFRIELGEIEAALENEADVRQAVVIARELAADDQRLVAYVVPASGRSLEVASLRESLRRHLPEYMVPQHFVVLDKLPSTPNGKVDRKALPAPALAGVVADATTTIEAERSAWVAREEACHSRIAPRTLRDFGDFETRMNSLCTAYAVRHLVSAGITMRAGATLSRQTVKARLRVLPALDRYVDYLLNTLVEDGVFVADGGNLRCLHGADEFPVPDEALRDLQRAHPEFGGVMQMLAHCFAHLADALSGTIPAISVLFPDGRRDFLDRLLFRETIEHTNIRVYEELARDYVVARARQRPTRILEVGGGTGMLTWRLLPELKGLQAEYVFTDVGTTFIAEARKKAAALGLDFVECRKFDITRAGGDQGFAEGSFDLILGLNVVHATPDLSVVIGHLTRLLKPDGALCLVEYVKSPRWQNLIWGLTEGWWYFRDAWRTSVPLIGLDRWEQVLRQGGLAAWALPVDPDRRDSTDAGMLVATLEKAVGQSEVARMEAPRTAVEKQLHTLWGQVLKHSPIGIRDNFFDLGGHSLLAVRLFAEIEHQMGRKLPLATLFSAPTIERLAREFDTTKASPQEWASLVAIQPHGTKPALYCVHGAGGNILLYRDLVERLGFDYPVYGFQSRGLDGRSRPLVSVEDMAENYLAELKSVQANGPYCLAGYCLGGLVAYQMARMLREAGDEVAFVALFDTYNPTEVGQTSRMGVLLQRAKFHASNLARLRPRELGRYLQEKFRVARDGELFNLLGSGSESNNGGQASAPQFNEDPGGDAGVQRVNDRAAEAFRPLPYDGSIMLFKPQVNYDFFPDPEMGWGNMARGSLEVVELPVNPHAMLVKPFVEHLAAAIAKRLDKAGFE